MTALSNWVPSLDGEQTLGEAYAEMPGDDASVVPWYVRLLENPASPVALPGAIDLRGHDCVHIVFGRGTTSADEAFVLGVTMGSTGRAAGWQRQVFALAARHLYRGPWRLSERDVLLFHLAVEFIRQQGVQPLNAVRWDDLWDEPLKKIRSSLGIRVPELLRFFETERLLWPDSLAASRLPTVAHRDE
ncbi:Coq4 family protein [Micromonospora sp. R77]|uniref:Coq4 family protein n=1 Tax=Micromonospora sp. R77 TaxID=2925836 RepID=UPI001F61136D|nr:Coq4 family protein [Micromonospora sp. R77]MCI4066215.1 Coq4 family protein [Micromonospora sp. R77]